MNFEDLKIKENISLLFEGYYYLDLPPIIEWENYKYELQNIITNISQNKYDSFKLSEDGIITEFVNTQSPDYIFNDGIETVNFFDFKKNGGLREIQMPNIKYYCAFVYNTMMKYDDFFLKLYGAEENKVFIENSNSYLLFNESFYVHRDYDGDEIEIDIGKFAVRNDKKTGQLAFEENYNRYLDKLCSYLYTVKVDVESFYPNIYTHLLNELKNKEPYKSNIMEIKYFDFLDYYNMKVNNNQTKGILSGVYSSTVSAELLMICIDFEVSKILGDNVKYIRYVDDITFFSDSLEAINSILPMLQNILNKYRLRLNNTKTDKVLSALNESFTDIENVKKRFDIIDVENVLLDKELLQVIKNEIKELYNQGKKTEIKAALTILCNNIKKGKIEISSNSIDKEGVFRCISMLLYDAIGFYGTIICYKNV